MFSTGAGAGGAGQLGGGGAEDKLLEVSLEAGTGGVAASVRDRRRERHPGGGRRPRHPGPGEEEAGPGSRGSSFKRSVTGLVRKVSQKVARDTKEPLRRRGSRRTRQPSTKKSFRRSRSVKRSAADSDRERGGPPPPALLPAPSLLHRINLFVTSSLSNFLVLIGARHHPQLADLLAPDLPPGATEKEDIDLLPKRYRPDNLNSLCTATGFSTAEMKRLYRIFKSECPSGLITEEVFHNIFSKFFPLGAESYSANVSSYPHYVFSALAQEDSEVITFEDFVFGLSVLVKGSPEEKLEWTFHLYDLDGDGVISREEMEDVAMSIYELMGNTRDRELGRNFADESDICRKIELAFQKFDLDGDGVVDMEEFLAVCREDADIQRSLVSVHDITI